MSIELKGISHTYAKGMDYEVKALNNVSLTVRDGEFVGLIGHTGSGKSTLVSHLNGLLRADEGSYLLDGENIYKDGYPMKQVRFKVGLVFQYPEHQLFESTVLNDVCFGPKNMGLSPEEQIETAKRALTLVGLPEQYYQLSPFELSGGQKRRVAIAGVLAMKPKILILDEPTAGLDPRGRDEVLELVRYLHEKENMTIILVSHSMEDVARYVDRILVMDAGTIAFDGTPREVFSHKTELESMGLALPQVMYCMEALKERGFGVDTSMVTVEEAVDEILKVCARKREGSTLC